MHGIQFVAGLPVAKIPLPFVLIYHRLGRGVAEGNHYKRRLVIGQGHVADYFHGKIGHLLGSAKRQRTGRQAGDAVGVKYDRRNHLRFRLGIQGIDLPIRRHYRIRTRCGVIILELVQTGRKLHVLPNISKSKAQRPVPSGSRSDLLVVDQ